MKKLILPILGLIVLLSSCQKENIEYNMLLDEMTGVQEHLTEFASDMDEDISKSPNPYDTLMLANQIKDEMLDDVEILKAKLIALEDIIKSDTYDSAQEKIIDLEANIKQSTAAANKYYVDNISDQISTILDEFALIQTKGEFDMQSSLELFDEIGSLKEYSVIEDTRLQGQNAILASFIACRNSYIEWIGKSQDFATTSTLSQNRQSSMELTNNYLQETTTYYDSYSQALLIVSSLDSSFHENVDKFLEILPPYTSVYESTIVNLEYVLIH